MTFAGRLAQVAGRSRAFDVREVEVFENERYVPIMGWSAKGLLPTDRRRFTVGRNDTEGMPEFPVLRLPPGAANVGL